jgi:hypothetical protein
MCCLATVVAGQGGIQIIPVPFNPSDPTIPHPAYNGHEVTVKAIVRGVSGSFSYRVDSNGDGIWDFPGQSGFLYSAAPYNLEIRAALPFVDPNVTQSALFNAIIEVTSQGLSAVAQYPIRVFAEIPAEHNDTRNPPVLLEPDVINAEAASPLQLKIMTQVAIDDALWWLHTQMTRNGAPSAAMTGFIPGTDTRSIIARTALFAIALQRNGHTAAYPPGTYNNFGSTPPASFTADNNVRYASDPYSEDLTRALNYLMSQLNELNSIPTEDESDDGRSVIPGTNDGVALYVLENYQDEKTHQALVLEALALSGLAGTVAQAGPAFVQGKSIQFIVQQLVDYCVFSQIDSGDELGGWNYSPAMTNNACAYMSGAWFHALCMVEQFLGADDVVVNNRVKLRIPNMLVRNQLPSGGPSAFNLATSPEFETVGHALLACRYLGWDNWTASDPTPAGYAPDPSVTRGYYRQIYDKYVTYIDQSWQTSYTPSGPYSASRVFWNDGNHASTNRFPKTYTTSNLWTYSLFTVAEALTYGGLSLSIGTRNWYHDFMVSLVNGQHRQARYYEDAGYSYHSSTGGLTTTTAYAILAMSTPNFSGPVAVASASPQTVVEGCSGTSPIGDVTFSHNQSYHPLSSAQIVEYQWLFNVADPSAPGFDQIQWANIPMNSFSNDGRAWHGNSSTIQPVFRYLSAGTYNAVLRLIDNQSPPFSNTDQVMITVVQQPPSSPVASAGGLYTIAIGDDLELNGTATDANTACGDVLTATWDLNADNSYGDGVGLAPTVTWATLVTLLGHTPVGNETILVKLKVTDATALESTSNSTVTFTAPLDVDAGPDQMITLGYGAPGRTITAIASGGNPPYTYNWSSSSWYTTIPGGTITIAPTLPTTYTVTVTDAGNQSASDAVFVDVQDWRCGNNLNKVTMCHNGNTICVAEAAVQAHLAIGDQFGACQTSKRGSTGPLAFDLSQNYPNPFNPMTKIEYSVPEDGKIQLIVYDLFGREVARLVDGVEKAGSYDIEFDGSTTVSGIYIYRLEWNGCVTSRKMLLLK